MSGASIPVDIPYEVITALLEPASPYGEVVLSAPSGTRVVDAYITGPVPFLDVGVIYDNATYNIRRGDLAVEFRCSPTADSVIATLICIGV